MNIKLRINIFNLNFDCIMIQKIENRRTIIYLLWFNLIAFATTSYLLYNSILTDAMPFVFLAIFLITISAYFIFKKKHNELFGLDNGELVINQRTERESIRFSCEDIKFFETKFNEIVIYQHNDEKFSIRLDDFKSNKERWELKEFLRSHIRERQKR